MPRKEKRYHYIYKTTNLLNGKYYIGMHSTDDLDDGYMGSGKRLRRSLNKHGKDNHKVEILEFVDTREELKKREEEIVNLNEIAKVECMNLKVGGYGGLSSDKHKEAFIKAGVDNFNKTKEQRLLSINKTRATPEHKTKMSKVLSEYYKENDNGFKGKSHSEETKKLLSDEAKLKTGNKNSQYGTCWITNGTESKKIYKGDNIPDGWFLGRKMK